MFLTARRCRHFLLMVIVLMVIDYPLWLCDTMEVSMLRLAWLPIAQHVFQPTLTGRLELISRKIVSSEQEQLSRWADFVKNCLPRIECKELPRFREKYRALRCHDISNSMIYTTAIYRAYTVVIVRVLCSWSQAGIEDLCFQSSLSACIMCIAQWLSWLSNGHYTVCTGPTVIYIHNVYHHLSPK